MKKNIFALLLALVLLLCSACTIQVNVPNKGGESSTPSSDVSEPETPDEPEEKSVVRGTVSGNTYYNEFTGLTFEKPDSWEFYTDEELCDTFGCDMDDYDDFTAAAESSMVVYDMMAIDPITGVNINVCFENVIITNGSPVTEKVYMDAVLGLFEDEDIGATVLESDYVTLGGKDYLRTICEMDFDGYLVDQAYYACSMGDFVTGMVITFDDEYPLEEIEAMLK